MLDSLIQGCLKNDRKAQYQLYEMFYQDLMRLSRRYKKNEDDAAVIVNETFFRAFTQMNTYKTDIPFHAWLKRITLNLLIDDFRKSNKMMEISQDNRSVLNEIDLSKEIYNIAESKLLASDILKILDELNENQKLVFNLYELDGYSHKEISSELKVSERTTKRYLAEARETLKSKITRLFNTAKALVL